jgi:hypothetical protein
MVLPFFFPAELILGSFGDPEEAKNLAGKVLRLIQIRLIEGLFNKNYVKLSVRRGLIFM